MWPKMIARSRAPQDLRLEPRGRQCHAKTTQGAFNTSQTIPYFPIQPALHRPMMCWADASSGIGGGQPRASIRGTHRRNTLPPSQGRTLEWRRPRPSTLPIKHLLMVC